MITRKAELLISRKVEGVQNFTGLIEFLVILTTFIVASSLFPSQGPVELLVGAFIFACVASGCMAIARLLLTQLGVHRMGVISLMLKNALGMSLAAIAVSLAQSVASFKIADIAEIVIVCVIGFFVLGTLIPLIKADTTRSI